MEEIKLAAGVKSPVSVSEDTKMPPPKLPSSDAIPMEANSSRKASHDSPEVTISNPGYHEQQSHTNYSDKSKAAHDATSRDYEQRKQGHHKSHHYRGDQRSADEEKHRSRASTSPERHRSHSRSHDHRVHHKKQDYSNENKYNNSSRTKDRDQKDTHKNHISDSFSRSVFSERYDPSEYHDIKEHDSSPDDKYIKPDKFYHKELN
jgi:U11/U12 small nuclear ribonucleoprotein SNRNP48